MGITTRERNPHKLLPSLFLDAPSQAAIYQRFVSKLDSEMHFVFFRFPHAAKQKTDFVCARVCAYARVSVRHHTNDPLRVASHF